MRYRSFGNEAVRNPVPPAAPAPTEDQAFSALGDALSGVEDLPPDTVMAETAPVPTETPMLPVRESYPTYPTSYPDPQPTAPDPYALLERAPPAPLPSPVAPPQPVAVLPAVPPAAVVPPVPTPAPVQHQPYQPPQPAPMVPPTRPVAAPEPPGSSLLQVLLGGPVPPRAAAPSPAPSSPPVVPAAPAAAEPELAASARSAPVLPHSAPAAPVQPAPAQPTPVQPVPVQPAARVPAAPVVPQAAPLPMPMLAALPAASWPPAGFSGGTGSSLLDTLMGVGAGPAAGTIHYPLLDALGDAMRGSAADPSPRHWPAARVDIALPELLRRIAAGVRFARTAA
ncbi:hypothetical protein VQH23_21980 [Pararoseomonas sp. SCSIO 73927]|uniref:hypothetical protein n=1 Tax=Pararoseomonas sp. SCSIO 73927 TaxID=3114537 RepID=UPI0030D1E1D2